MERVFDWEVFDNAQRLKEFVENKNIQQKDIQAIEPHRVHGFSGWMLFYWRYVGKPEGK